ncbi:MAG: hypothetical protein LKI59_09825 [Bacteroidales bacterium]|jgi:hypothetical protein|nr:hypothetical protein [Bacteroidales bacterium]
MKKLIALLFVFIRIYCSGQGLNNNYKIDSEDIKNVFEYEGIHVFKYPFNLGKGEYVSIGYDVFENGKLIENKHIIEDFQTDAGITFNSYISRKDTTALYRFYFLEKGDSLEMHEVMPGFSGLQKIDISKIATGGFNSRINVPADLSVRHELLYYYGLFKNGEKIKKTGGWLPCSTGLPKDKLIRDYDFVIMFYAEKK